MAQIKRRYTTIKDGEDWIVTVTYDENRLDTKHWFEAQVEAFNEKSREAYKFPPEIKTYRVGEVEHSFKEFVKIDFGGDREAALSHFMDTIYRRVYMYIERGH